MATDWAADVKKYVANADDAAIAGIVRYCGIALTRRDSSLVSFSDSKETNRVRDNFLRKKLALTDSDAVLDAAIAKVGDILKADRTKNRVTVYYLLADQFGKLGLFIKSAAAAPAAKKAPAKKAPAKKAAAVATPAKKVTAKTATAKKTTAKTATAKTASAKKATAKKATAKKATAKKAPAKTSQGKAAAAVSLASMSSAKAGTKTAANDRGVGATAAPGAAGSAAAGTTDVAGKAAGAATGAAGMAATGAGKVTGAASSRASEDNEGGWSSLLWLMLGLLGLLLLWWLLFGGS